VKVPLTAGSAFSIRSGDVQARGLLGFKAAGFWPGNRERGNDAHQATILLIDPITGRPVCIIDGNAVTTMRTGAAGAIALAHLAKPGSSHACLFGTGVQARIQLEYALRVLPALHDVLYVTAAAQRDVNFEAHFAERCNIKHATDRNAAVAASDVTVWVRIARESANSRKAYWRGFASSSMTVPKRVRLVRHKGRPTHHARS
jgi:alanine dehydrogenase